MDFTVTKRYKYRVPISVYLTYAVSNLNRFEDGTEKDVEGTEIRSGQRRNGRKGEKIDYVFNQH